MTKPWLTNLLLCTGGSVLLAAAFAPLGGLWLGPVAFVALVPFAVLIERTSRSAALLWSYAAGLIFFLLGTCWLAWVTVAGWMILCAYLAVYFVLAAAEARALRRWCRLPMAVALPVACTTAELIRARLFTGLPWLQLGHTQHHALALIQMADVTGVYGLSFLLAAVNGAIFDLLAAARLAGSHTPQTPRRARLAAGSVAVALLAVLGYGWFRLNTTKLSEGPAIAVVQANIPQDVKHDPTPAAVQASFEKHLELSREALASAGSVGGRLDLIVWPETMLPASFTDREAPSSQEMRRRLTGLARQGHCRILAGIAYDVEQDNGLAAFNSALYIDQSGSIDDRTERYDKMHLVPFGEYVPLDPYLSFLQPFVPYRSGFRPGRNATIFQLAGSRFGVLICFEDVFAQLAAGQFCRDGPADFLVNLSNEGWFTHGYELEQHLAISRFRAVENRAGMVRATNTGISAFIDPTGRLRSVLERDGRRKQVSGVLVDRVMLDARRTVYTRWPDAFAGLVAAAGAVATAAGWSRNRRKG